MVLGLVGFMLLWAMLVAELWAVWHGLCTAWELGHGFSANHPQFLWTPLAHLIRSSLGPKLFFNLQKMSPKGAAVAV